MENIITYEEELKNIHITSEDIKKYFPGFSMKKFIEFSFISNDEPYRNIMLKKMNDLFKKYFSNE